MKFKIAALDKKFDRYTARFVKFYEQCGTDGDETRKRRDGKFLLFHIRVEI